MTLTSSPDSPRSSPEFHDQPSDPHHDEEVSVLSTSKRAPVEIADSACHGPPCSPDSPAHTGGPQGWNRLIYGPTAPHERISLITDILSDRNEVETVRSLCGDDAHTFVDMIYEAGSQVLLSPNSRLADFDSNICALSIRPWMTLTRHHG